MSDMSNVVEETQASIKKLTETLSVGRSFSDIIETVKEIDPDSARFGELIWLKRASVGLKTYGLRYRISNRDDITFEAVAAWVERKVGGYFFGVNYARAIEVSAATSVVDIYIVVERVGISATVHLFGNPERVSELYKEMEVMYKAPKTVKVTTLLDFGPSGPVVSETELIETKQKLAKESFYPFLSQGIQETAEAFKASDSAVLLLIGPPGTGKSTFLRTLIYSMGCTDVAATSSQPALENPGLISWISSCSNSKEVVIIEDADKLTGRRGDGGNDNYQMSGILNITEGLVKSKLKVIISTNLESINKIDPALLRPGRLFKILQFRPLTVDEAIAVRDDLGMSPDGIVLDKQHYTLAEATNMISSDDALLRKQTKMSMI